MKPLPFARASLFAALFLGTHAASFADALGYRAYQQDWDPAKPTVTSVKQAGALYGALSTDLVNAWNQFTAQATPIWTSGLSAPNLAGNGYTLENPRLKIGGVDSTELRTAAVPDSNAPSGFQSPSPSAPILVIHSSGTRLDAGSTTPYTTRDTDPTFHVTFDLTTYIKLSAGPGVSAVSVPNAVVTLSNAQYTPDNATAKDAQALSFLQTFFGSPTFSQTITSSIDGTHVNITGWLGPAIKTANDQLHQQAPAGYVVAGIFADPQYLNFVLAPHVQPDAAGQMSGTLTVTGESNLPASARSTPVTAQDCSKIISLGDTVQVQPDYVGNLNPVTILAGSGPTQALDSQIAVSSGSITSSANGWSCQYAVRGLADKLVNNIHFIEPAIKASNGSLPAVGYVIDIAFAGCAAGGTGLDRVSPVACMTSSVCSGTLIPQSGQPLNCNLSGLIGLSASNGVGIAKQSAFASPAAVNPGGPLQNAATVSPSVWGAQSANRAVTPTASPAWGSTATTAAQTPGQVPISSSIGRSVGSSLQARPMQSVQAPTQAVGSQF